MDAMLERPSAGTIPDAPGSYQFKDRDGRVIYVGKAKSLRQRLATYFQNPALLPPRTAQMVAAADTVEWIEVANEVEALLLEYSLIQRHKPRFNVRYRDDKSYPYLAITVSDRWPRAMVMRGAKRRGVRYFGPYAHAYAIRETLDLLLRTFPIRTCSDNKLSRHERLGRPCLLGHIGKCSAPCAGEVDEATYGRMVADLIEFLEGDTGPVLNRLEEEMREAAAALEFERAAWLRDRLAAVRKVIERQQMVAERDEDIDVVGIAGDELEAAVQVFLVRRGRVVGRRGFVVDKVEEMSTAGLVGSVIERLYAEAPPEDVPREVLVPELPDDPALYEAFLAQRRGAKVALRVPRRGGKRALQATVTQNAREEFVRHRLRRSADHNARARALTALQEALDLPEFPLRIECFDMSHIQGSDYVGSMVVMEDGLPRPSDYRRFKVRTVGGNDDYAAMEEVLTRRLRALVEERERSFEAGRPRRFAYPPNLILVDGGRGQLNVAVRVLEEFGLDDEIAVAALAKQFEEVYVPGRVEPVRIPRQSEALYLLQRVRDEAHRFALGYHRKLRTKKGMRSLLDEVPGVGPKRKAHLLRKFGTLDAIRNASIEELAAIPGMTRSAAEALKRAL